MRPIGPPSNAALPNVTRSSASGSSMSCSLSTDAVNHAPGPSHAQLRTMRKSQEFASEPPSAIDRMGYAAVMRSLLRPSPLVVRSLLAGMLVTGCATAPSPARPAPSRTAPKQVYSVWEFDTICELDQFLDIKGCEGWRLADVLTRWFGPSPA